MADQYGIYSSLLNRDLKAMFAATQQNHTTPACSVKKNLM
jgi:hypothetical protein